MRIGIDLQVVPADTRTPRTRALVRGKITGVSHYALMLAKYLMKLNTEHEFIFFERRNRRVPFWDAHIRDARLFKKANLDVLHGLAFTLPLTLALSRKGRGPKGIITIHDLAIYKHPEWFPSGQWFSTKILVPASIKKARYIIVPSESTRKDLLEIFGESLAEKIAVIPLGVEERFFRTAADSKCGTDADSRGNDPHSVSVQSAFSPRHRKYILSVATLEPRKNIARLVQAYSMLPRVIIEQYDLVIAGNRGWKTDSIESEIRSTKSEIRNKIKILGPVSSDRLPNLYHKAGLFVFPSLYEGFGLPVLEAMAGGVPVITSNLSSLPDLVGEGGILVNPYNVQEIARSMEKALRSDNREMVKRAQKRAREFTWEKTAKMTLKIYESLY